MTKLTGAARTVLFGLAGLGSTISASSADPAAPASAETPEAFVRRLYTNYQNDAEGVPRDRPGGTRFFAAPLLDAFAKDAALDHGEIGAIDADPLCACQAFENFRVEKVTTTKGDAHTVIARVAFRNFRSPHVVSLTLSQTTDGWRIADVRNENMKSVAIVLREAIAQSLKDARRNRATQPKR